MKAIILQQAGGIDQLHIKEIDKPAIKENEVLVKIAAISVNPVDYNVRSNPSSLAANAGHLTLKPTNISHEEAAAATLAASMKKSLIKLFSLAAVGLLLTSSRVTGQQLPSASLNQPGYYSMRLGDGEIIALSDGTAPQDLTKLLTNTRPGQIDSLSKANYQATTFECSVNAYLVKKDGKLILIDAGASNVYGPQLGHLKQNLISAGYKPEQIDAVLLTHIHMDHIGGIIDGETPVFPNATIYISQKEADFWLNPENKKNAANNQAAFFDGAQLKLAPIKKAGKLKTFEFGKELFPGITPIVGIGHTPGHAFYIVESRGHKIVFVGDILVSLPVQFAAPKITSIYDYEAAQAAKTRINILQSAASGGYWLAISHASFPGIGHIAASGEGFRWIPINYSSNGNGQ